MAIKLCILHFWRGNFKKEKNDYWRKEKGELKITVFTPTFNREHMISKLYHSLQRQSFKDFEWLVIDDGSIDGTEELFSKLVKEETSFIIRYYKFNNGGKHRAINRALDLSKGELFFTVDSDDLLTSNALYMIAQWDLSIPKNRQYCGFAGNDGDLKGKPTNPIFKEYFKDATFFDRNPESDNFIGFDRPWVIYTDIHKKYKYPEYEGEKFITEAVVWNRMAADGYKIRCYNDVIYLREHQEVGLTSKINEILVNNPKGYGLWIKELMQYRNYGILQRFKSYYAFYCEMRNKESIECIARYIGTNKVMMSIVKILYKIKHG